MKRSLNLGYNSEFNTPSNRSSYLTLGGDDEPEENISDINKKESGMKEKSKVQEEGNITFEKEPFYKSRHEEEYLDEKDDIADELDFMEDDYSSVEVIRVPEEETSIEGVPYARTEPGRPKKKKDEPREMMYGSETVAKLLGITSQTVRSYCDDFPDYITVRRKEKGQRVFTKENIDQLRYIIEIKDKKNLTKEELKAYLQDPEKYEMTDPERDFEAMKQMIITMMQQMDAHNMKLLQEYQNMTQRVIEDKENTTASILKDVLEKVDAQQKELAELTGIVKKDDDASKEKDKEELAKAIQQIEELKNTLDKKNDLAEKLRAENEIQAARIQELEKKKKGGLFGFLK